MSFAPEIYLALVALALFFVSLAEPRPGVARRVTLALAAGGVVVAALAFGAQGDLFSGTYRVDDFSQSFKFLIALGFFLAVAFSEGLRGIETRLESEYHLFLALRVPLRRSEYSTQVEAGIKYVLFGAVASGVSLFGMSYVFGLTGTSHLDQLVQAFLAPVTTASGETGPILAATPMGIMSLTMMFGGFFYKLALFPFHFWTPDIYQGAANETSGVIATLPKVGAVAVLIRLTGLGGHDSGGFLAVLTLLAIVSMTYGNLAALVQTDLKRLLAYSSISHAGFMMTGILSGSVAGYAGAMYYVGGYLLMNLALFHVIYTLGTDGRNVTIDDLKGLHRRAPVLALTLAVGAFGLAGIPPTAGFAGKFFVLTAALEQGHLALVIIAAINTAISIYYYLKMVKAAYSPEEEEPATGAPADVSLPGRLLGGAFALAILLVGAFPGSILALFHAALDWAA
jgi:NADH-quinone oxidoreductase subunit N